MIPILLESDREFSSSWVETRGRSHVQISGMKEGDTLRIVMKGNKREITVYLHEDRKIEIHPLVTHVRAIHHKASGSRVCVELTHGS